MRIVEWVVVPAFLGVACSSSPPPAAHVMPAPVVSAVPAVTAVVERPAAPVADDGPPPQPPMAMRWTYQLPSTDGRPWTKQHLAIAEDGAATWESESGGGDGEIDETLSPVAGDRGASPAVRCRGHVGPGLHRRIVEAARRAMASGCQAKAAPVDAAVTSLAVTWEGEIKACNVARSGGGYAAFEQVKTELVAAACARR